MIELFSLHSSSNATSSGRSLLRGYGNGEEYSGMVDDFHVALSRSSKGSTG